MLMKRCERRGPVQAEPDRTWRPCPWSPEAKGSHIGTQSTHKLDAESVCSTHQVRQKTCATEILDTSLSRLGLLLATNNGDQRDVDERKVVVSDSPLELTQSLDEGC